jgi:uncharacterized protein (DUF1697 family)
MQRYAAFLRGVSPMNAKMPELAKAFAGAGFRDVKTLLSSGNVVFSAQRASDAALQRKAEAAMARSLGKSFETFVRPIAHLQALLDADPFARHDIPPAAKRVVTFLHEAPAALPALPIEQQGARILAVHGREVLTCYVPVANSPVFMQLIARHFGQAQTTRTWDTLRKVCAAGAS